jgi:predicted RNase H-like HicB family nuclease
MKYEIIIYWGNEDGVFIAEVPELPGCMVHGDSQELALAQAQEATRLWIDTATEFGDPIPPGCRPYSARSAVAGSTAPARAAG